MNSSTAAPRSLRPLLLRAPKRAAGRRSRGAPGSTGYEEASIDAESVVSGVALVGLLCFACLLFASFFELGVLS